mmetsp:Transcript_39862/g.97726  ORF Transcript_39862/g.97726 Transcript_39862/m.97726 type:complete len:230 (-) Transcript_39862:165-854(-)
MMMPSRHGTMSSNGGRDDGSGCQHAFMSCASGGSVPSGTTGRTCFLQMAVRKSLNEWNCLNGSSRVKISHSTMPNEYTSHFSSNGRNSITSGAIHSGVPLADFWSRATWPSGSSCDRPKSHTRTRMFSSYSRFDGLRSRWMNFGFDVCSQFMPCAASRAIFMRSVIDRRTPCRRSSSASRSPPLMRSVTIRKLFGCVHAPMNRQMRGWYSRDRFSISFLNASIALASSD